MMRLKRAGTKRTRGQTLTLKVMEYTVYNKICLIRVLGEIYSTGRQAAS